MKIIFIASLKSYTTSFSLIRAFKKNGCDVIVLSDVDSDYVYVNEIVEANFDISNYINENKLDISLVFFCEGGSMKLFPQGLEKLQCKTAWYGIDTHMDFSKHLEIAKFFDVTFLAQKQYISSFIQKGISNTFWLPLAYDKTMAPSKKNERIYDIAYVGSVNKEMHSIRFELIEKLKKEFPNSYFGGADAKGMYKIYSQAKIVFNKSINNDINMRYFEALGNGAMLLTDKIINNGVEEIFIRNTHYLEYTEENIIDVAKNYLKSKKVNSDELEEYILDNHTYDIRAKKIVEIVNNFEKTNKNIKQIDYAKIYLMLENFCAFLESLRFILKNEIICHSRKRKLFFLPLLFVLKMTIFIFKK